ncbi:hypothetical protein HanHA300_Chr13g0474871 [Helianthus annuus]|nr:hypothetical protein HanHA300_Chr13g0474871 [Helianthus annuus]KAJ0480332.1 hypothetical protein HanIR_Chr13g0630421 [Helianthus annuus]KAJ0497028.1 hypothetical protein HanHA89_Chr13g0506791 [Helianthus annuus]KAJ0670552.1 hypothetical protein HanOQP8_Chr13g0475711 [Helianthus annuus]
MFYETSDPTSRKDLTPLARVHVHTRLPDMRAAPRVDTRLLDTFCGHASAPCRPAHSAQASLTRATYMLYTSRIVHKLH